ncbi:MAG: DUF58 domain-containing protein [Proteobacteria bacterium]|nr:DUF58 domain-containing protein [Pseudomonadota bacterium]MBU1736714.1 DUF58 domain-containing protein [Pseudomonadota bacterium]
MYPFPENQEKPGRTNGNGPTGAYLALTDLIRLRFGARELKLNRQRKTFSLLVGPHQTRFRGRGIEFEEVRAYQAGDDIRSIDWRVTARSGKPHTKLFREERERPVLLLVDQGLSMFFGSRTCFKSVMAAHIASLLAWAAFQQNDRVGGLVFNASSHSEVRPKRSARNVLQLLNAITTFNLLLNREMVEPDRGINRGLEELHRITRPGSNIFLISDFHGFNDQGRENLFQLSRHNDITAFLVFDPLEKELPPPGTYSFTDGRNRFRIFTGSRSLRTDFQNAYTKRHDRLKGAFDRMGIPLIPVSTVEKPLYFLRDLFRAK